MASVLLNLLIFLPLVGGAVVWLLPERKASLAPRIALCIGLLTLLFALALWPAVEPARLAGESVADWIRVGESNPSGDLVRGVLIRFHIGLDGISAPLVMLTALLVPLSIACGFAAIKHRVREYYAWMLALTGGMFGVFAARDLMLFYVFFEFTLVPLYFLIGIWGGPERRFAANKFFLYTFVGSVVTFAGILYLAVRAAALSGSDVVRFDIDLLSSIGGLTPSEQSFLFIAFFCGFAIKVPFFPFHTWLPLAHTEAPTAGSVLLAGVLLKLGTYGFLRFSLPMVPAGAIAWAQFMGILALIGIIYAALVCWVQTDVKKLIAYSSVSHLGFCMLGMFSLLPVGLSGSVLYMINHGISTGALFLVIGMIYERYHTREMDELGGLARQMPILASFLILFVLSSIGLPGLNGFVSEFTVLLAAYNSAVLGPIYGVIGASGILLGAIYMLYMTGKILFGPLKEPKGTPDLSAGLTRDLNRREIAILAPLAVAVVLLGVYPRIITDKLDPALRDQILNRLNDPLEEWKQLRAAAASPPGAVSPAGAEEIGAETVFRPSGASHSFAIPDPGLAPRANHLRPFGTLGD
ncbi:MAG: NADH-quinone oxidoreductase subunit M [Planctomycetes bacterium]|nr:NADH-quinone oxidoreductase subunit M [Planctomycetota bacterium]